MLLSARVLLPELRIHDRWRGWGPVLATAGALLAYQIGLAVLGAGAEQPMGGPLDLIAVLLLAAGGAVRCPTPTPSSCCA